MEKSEQAQYDVFEHPKFTAQDFVKDDYIHLWEYFENRADMLKDRLWTIGTWLLGFNSAILGFIFGSQLITIDPAGFIIRTPAVVLALALIGCALCLYAFFLIKDYGKHIQRNWDRAKVLKEKLPLVEEILGDKPEKKDQDEQNARLPKIAQYIYGFALGYLASFLVIAAMAVISLLRTSP